MATITARKGKKGTTYQAIVRLRGHKPITKTHKRRSDAKAWAKKIEAQIQGGDYATSEAERHTLGELIDHYLSHEETPTARKSNLLWWKEQIGEKKLSEVTPAVLSALKQQLKETSGSARCEKRSPATVNRYLAYLSAVYKRAVQEYQWVSDNPVKKVAKEREPRGRTRFLSDDERERLLAACKAEDEMLYELVVTALATGARAGELLSLQWQDIDFEKGFALLHNTKNGETRSIPIMGHTADLLRKRRGIGRVFPSPSGNAVYDYAKPFKAALAASGVDNFRFHDLRHTAAAAMAQNGVTLLAIAHVLGHKSIQMTQRYAHLCTKTVTEAGELLNRKMFE